MKRTRRRPNSIQVANKTTWNGSCLSCCLLASFDFNFSFSMCSIVSINLQINDLNARNWNYLHVSRFKPTTETALRHFFWFNFGSSFLFVAKNQFGFLQLPEWIKGKGKEKKRRENVPLGCLWVLLVIHLKSSNNSLPHQSLLCICICICI